MEINTTFFLNDCPDHSQTDAVAKPILGDFETIILITVFYCILGSSLNLVGTVTNLINIVVLYNMGFSETINIGLMGMAVSDLFSLLSMQWTNICFNPWVYSAQRIPFDSYQIEYLTAGWPRAGFARITGMITAYISFERCLCVMMPLKVKTILTPGTTSCIVVAIILLNLASIAPVFVVNGLDWMFSISHNRSVLSLVFYANKVEVEPVLFLLNASYAYIAFGVVILCTTMLIRKLRSKSKWRRDIGHANSINDSDTKERRIVIIVATICVVFIICCFPATLLMISMMSIPEFKIGGGFENLIVVLFSFSYLLETTNATANFFIYLRMSRKFRTTLYRLVHKRDPESTQCNN